MNKSCSLIITFISFRAITIIINSGNHLNASTFESASHASTTAKKIDSF